MSITDELREWMRVVLTDDDPAHAIADRIDAEYEEKVSYWQGVCYEDGYKEGLEDNDCAMAEHGWVRKNKEHVISHATFEITPHIDWSRMADELDEFAEIVRGMAGDAE
jgi:hypothetical protein